MKGASDDLPLLSLVTRETNVYYFYRVRPLILNNG